MTLVRAAGKKKTPPVTLSKVHTEYLPYTVDFGNIGYRLFSSQLYNETDDIGGAVERLAYDPQTQLVYVVGFEILHVVNLTAAARLGGTGAGSAAHVTSLPLLGHDVTDVAPWPSPRSARPTTRTDDFECTAVTTPPRTT